MQINNRHDFYSKLQHTVYNKHIKENAKQLANTKDDIFEILKLAFKEAVKYINDNQHCDMCDYINSVCPKECPDCTNNIKATFMRNAIIKYFNEKNNNDRHKK